MRTSAAARLMGLLLLAACAEQKSDADRPDGAADGDGTVPGGLDAGVKTPNDAATTLDVATAPADAPDAAFSPRDAAPIDGPPAGKLVFVTSTSFFGDLAGVTGADAKCHTVASKANLPGSWSAWLSTSTMPAAARLTHATQPYLRTDGTRVAADWNDLVDGTLLAPIATDENGAPRLTDVWTGTLADGTAQLSNDCLGYQDGTFANKGLCGNSGAVDARWTNNVQPSCNTGLSLYCVQQ